MLRNFIMEKRIPKDTPYCYEYRKSGRLKACPYWKCLKYKDSYGNHLYYCKYLKIVDTHQGDSLLWDMVKECGINDEWED